jgi:hypothetical protein
VGQINPNNLFQQYGNADYDTRHYISRKAGNRRKSQAGIKVRLEGLGTNGASRG